MPSTSIFLPERSRLGRCRNRTAEVIAIAPSGMLIHMHQRQPIDSVNQPPSSGPATDDSANTPPMIPM